MAWFIHSAVGILFGYRLESIDSPPTMTLFSVYFQFKKVTVQTKLSFTALPLLSYLENFLGDLRSFQQGKSDFFLPQNQ